jgi:hypothetical protein
VSPSNTQARQRPLGPIHMLMDYYYLPSKAVGFIRCT